MEQGLQRPGQGFAAGRVDLGGLALRERLGKIGANGRRISMVSIGELPIAGSLPGMGQSAMIPGDILWRTDKAATAGRKKQ